MGGALKAIAGGLSDVLGWRLGGLALACLALAVAATSAAAWAAFKYLLPLIPEGEGWRDYFLDAGQVLAGLGVVILAVALAPAVSMFVGGALFDVAAARIEKHIGAPPGRLVSLGEGIFNGLKIAWPALALNLLSLPLLFVPVLNLIWFLSLNGYLMGREYSALAAVRRMSWAEARALRRHAPLAVFLIGLACSLIPFVAPLVGAGAMTRWVSQSVK